MVLFLLFCTSIGHSYSVEAVKRELVVETNYGNVKGFFDSLVVYNEESDFTKTDTKEVACWLGVPFAEPPVGKLRFKPPVAKKPWTDTLAADVMGPSCYHQLIDYYNVDEEKVWLPIDQMTEDCLYLNIWAPAEETSSKLPVMIWIFGGGFLTGTANLPIYNGAILAANGKLIVVSIQYRIGMLGFLYGNTADCPGNQGIMDQYLAIKWVSENIEYFGGNRGSITLFGESSGSVSVGIHVLSPKTSVLFQRAIMQSGSPTADWSVISREVAENRTRRLFTSRAFIDAVAYLFRCCLNESEATVTLFYRITEMVRKRMYDGLIEYLRRMPARSSSSNWKYHWSNMEMELYSGAVGYGLVPVVDKDFVVNDPRTSSSMDKHLRFKQLLIGFNANEGTYFNVYVLSNHGVNLSSQIPKMPRALVGRVLEESVLTHYPTQPFRPDSLFYKIIQLVYGWSIRCFSTLH